MASHSTGDGSIPPREALKKGLKRIMTVGGAYGSRNYTVKDLMYLKGKRVLVETVPFSTEEAVAAEEAGIDHPSSCRAGADAIMCQWSPRLIEAATEAGVPVQGHAGLVPRRSTWTGGLKAVGKTLEEAIWIFNQIKEFEEAGAYAVEVEVVPEDLLIEITKRTSLLTSSIGAGKGGDIQFLFAEDILGNNGPPYPRHSKQYRELYKMKREMQLERIAGFKEFIEEVKNGNFPLEEHVIKAPSGLIESFVEKIKNTK